MNNMIVSEAHDKMRDKVRTFSLSEVAKEVERMERNDRFPYEIVKRMGELELMGIPIPKEYGGSGMDYTSYMIAIHELSKVSAALGVILSVHTSVGTNPILYFGTEQQKRRYIPKLATGAYLGAFALTEPGAGSDVSSLKMTAKKSGDHYILNGSKSFITNGGVANTYITFARTSREGGSKGISAFIVEADTEGLTIGKNERKMGLRGSRTVSVTFDQCKVPNEQLLGKEGNGFKIAMANLTIGRIGIAAQALGIAEASYEYALAHAKKKKLISKQQDMSFTLAQMATEVEAAKLLTYYAASLVDFGQNNAKYVSMAKLLSSKTAVKTATQALQILGQNGYSDENPAARFFRDAKVTEIYEGTSEIQHLVIAKHLLKG